MQQKHPLWWRTWKDAWTCRIKNTFTVVMLVVYKCWLFCHKLMNGEVVGNLRWMLSRCCANLLGDWFVEVRKRHSRQKTISVAWSIGLMVHLLVFFGLHCRSNNATFNVKHTAVFCALMLKRIHTVSYFVIDSISSVCSFFLTLWTR